MKTLLAALAIMCASATDADANGAVQREVEGRVESFDAVSGRMVIVREFRGRTWRVEVTAGPASTIFACSGERVDVDRLRAGTPLGVFYEVVGSEGIANLIMTEPER
ncbi:MAG: hypothetical protein FJZ38_13735 [Candidatus Rokubacteria bacterium]|nr:hypothetical protein [Candidatus Rokubacteria bacterium]